MAVWLLFLLYGVYMGVADGNGRALLAELAPADRRATAFGAYHGVVGLAALPASAIAGLLWDNVSPAAPFVVGAVGALLAALLLPLLVRTPVRV
jgi:MFS family permease